MLIAIIGPSGSGKSKIVSELKNNFDISDVIQYTTRNQRPGEKNHIDYHFISQDIFNIMEENGKFLEVERYSQGRFYATGVDGIVKALADKNCTYAIVVTPGGLRAIEKIAGDGKENLISIYLDVPLGERVKRYIERCGIEKFNFDDMNEINARVNRDFGMFLGVENEVDFVIKNYNKPVREIAEEIVETISEEIVNDYSR